MSQLNYWRIEMIKVDELRTYANQRINHSLKIGEIVKYLDKYYLVEKLDLRDSLTLTPMMIDPSRDVLTLE